MIGSAAATAAAAAAAAAAADKELLAVWLLVLSGVIGLWQVWTPPLLGGIFATAAAAAAAADLTTSGKGACLE